MLVSGIEVPELSSPRDLAIRGYMHVQRQRRLSHSKLMIESAMFTSGRGEMGRLREALKKYVNTELLVDDINENTDKSLRDDYEKIRHLVPNMSIGKEGGLTVKGILGELDGI